MLRQRLAIVMIVVGTLVAGYAIGGGIDNIIRAVRGDDFTVSLAGCFLGLGIGVAVVGWLLADPNKLPGVLSGRRDAG